MQAIFDTRYQLADRRHLVRALSYAESLGLLTALVVGLLLGGRAVAPLADALSRQRRFVADASHELRTPIARVHTRAQLLARRAQAAPLPAEHRTDLDRLIGTTRVLGEIVDDLLLSAQLGNGARLTAAPVDLTALAADAVAQDAERAAARDVRLVAVADGAALTVPGVPSALRRVVAELISNALSHTPPGGTITVAVRAVGGLAELTVTDTGAGLATADRDRIFHRFHRAASAPAGERHFGLGLALTREVVEAHGGTITADGALHGGATFTVRLPREPVPR